MLITRITLNNFLYNPSPERRIVGEMSKEHSLGVVLTRRETDVVEKLSEGKPDKIIASELQISVESVRYYLRALFLKYRTQSRTGVIVAYFNNKNL
jgi:DNA-binding NarL/FixJ family response regulator